MLTHRHHAHRRGTGVRAAGVLATAVGLGAVLLTGCTGPFGGASAVPSDAPAPAASAVVVAPDARVPDSDGGGVPAPSPSPSPSATPTPSGSPSATGCAQLRTAWNQTNQALVSLSPDHPRALVNSFSVAAQAMAGIVPPKAIADDWAAMEKYLTTVNNALENVDANDVTAVSSALTAAVSTDDTKHATASAQAVTTFVTSGCKQ